LFAGLNVCSNTVDSLIKPIVVGRYYGLTIWPYFSLIALAARVTLAEQTRRPALGAHNVVASTDSDALKAMAASLDFLWSPPALTLIDSHDGTCVKRRTKTHTGQLLLSR
jgi:hypothetical protein